MTIRTDLTIDWEVSPRVITVDSPSVVISMQDLLDSLRNEEAKPANMDDDSIVDAAGKEELGGGVLVGLTVTLLNAKLAFEARPGPDWIQCNAYGGNLVAVDQVGASMSPVHPTAYTHMVIANSSSATLQGLDEMAHLVWEEEAEGSFTFGQMMKLMVAALAGKLSGAPAGPIKIRDITDSKDRITATVDADGNRTGVSLDVSP
jgi:hypothetical protein